MPSLRDPANLTELFETAVAAYPDHPLFGTKNSAGRSWISSRVKSRRSTCATDK